MNKTTEALKLAEEALASIAFEKPSPVTVESLADIAYKALRPIREALAEPVKQEPVEYHVENVYERGDKCFAWIGDDYVQIFTAPVSVEAAVLAEREACAKVCEKAMIQMNYSEAPYKQCAAAIRARGEK